MALVMIGGVEYENRYQKEFEDFARRMDADYRFVRFVPSNDKNSAPHAFTRGEREIRFDTGSASYRLQYFYRGVYVGSGTGGVIGAKLRFVGKDLHAEESRWDQILRDWRSLCAYRASNAADEVKRNLDRINEVMELEEARREAAQ